MNICQIPVPALRFKMFFGELDCDGKEGNEMEEFGMMPMPADFRYRDVYEKGKPRHDRDEPFLFRHPPNRQAPPSGDTGIPETLSQQSGEMGRSTMF